MLVLGVEAADALARLVRIVRGRGFAVAGGVHLVDGAADHDALGAERAARIDVAELLEGEFGLLEGEASDFELGPEEVAVVDLALAAAGAFDPAHRAGADDVPVGGEAGYEQHAVSFDCAGLLLLLG